MDVLNLKKEEGLILIREAQITPLSIRMIKNKRRSKNKKRMI